MQLGQELFSRVNLFGVEGDATVLLESEALVVRGEPRGRIRFSDITSVQAVGGCLELHNGTATFAVGSIAGRWAVRIQNPPTLLDTLGIQPAMRFAVVGDLDPAFLAALGEPDVDLSPAEPRGEAIILLGGENVAELDSLADLQADMARNGANRVIHPRGSAAIRDSEVMDGAKRHDLVDFKVARFSASHTAAGDSKEPPLEHRSLSCPWGRGRRLAVLPRGAGVSPVEPGRNGCSSEAPASRP